MNDPPHPSFQIQIQRLHRLTVIARWFVVVLLWSSVGLWSLWGLREEIHLWREYFTWVALWYAFESHKWAALGLGLCLGMTLAVLVWQSRNILWGLPSVERRRLERQIYRIHATGSKHPLWKWVATFPPRTP
ncbi:MAG: hypothetical protein J7641_19630 [Cyanobacteria bacterium SID2]|nr:hypothetical protein [Cyanobacteria bacterium SID2]MBP0004253.1 hypothetical protein [Cyanobacteria bacterium SBC]